MISTTQDGQLNIRINTELKQAFLKKAKENNTNATELLIGWMKSYLNNELPQPDNNELAELKQRLAQLEPLEPRLTKLEQLVMGELAA